MSNDSCLVEISSSSDDEEEEEEEEKPAADVSPKPEVPEPDIQDLLDQAPESGGCVGADWQSLYPPRRDWGAADLEAPFSEHEIFLSLFFDPHSSSGGRPLCFFQAFWPFLKSDLLSLFDHLYRGRSRLPAPPPRLGVAGGLHALVRRVLAARLRSKLHFFADVPHTALAKAQFMLDSAASAQSIVDSCARNSWDALFVKLDFDKAFATVRWDFLLDALRVRGFGPRWVNCVQACLLWDQHGERRSRRGLRDHDPLSSCLFVLAVCTFTTMLWRAKLAGLFRCTVGNSIWPNHLASLQYSSDALILAPADRASLVNMKLLLYFFELLSGLRINFDRSCVYSLTGNGDASALAAEVLNCRVGKFPFIYMGMVLNSIELEIDEDCCILDYDPFDTTADEVKKKLSFSKDHRNDEEEEDLSILAEKGPVACRDYPHSRHLCAKYPFKKTPHESYCPQCYCYVCDVVAPCSYWKRSAAAHCHATDEDVIWRILRRDHLDSTRSKEITGGFDGLRA